MKEPTFYGLENYKTLIFEGKFFNPFIKTILFILTSVPLKVFIGLLLAVLFSSSYIKARRILFPLIIIPWSAPWFFLVLIWRGMFNQDFGIINQFLRSIGLMPINWLNDIKNAFISYNIVEVYLAYPFITSVIFAAIQSIPSDLYESAIVDGANAWIKFRYITIPLIKKSILWATIMTTIASYLIFGVPFLLNRGGPARENEFLLIYGYKESFDFGYYGYGAAFMVLVFIILTILVIVFLRLTRMLEE
jgi:arabinogalactan oligomer/maltooligosaccharide transport system permease protein